MSEYRFEDRIKDHRDIKAGDKIVAYASGDVVRYPSLDGELFIGPCSVEQLARDGFELHYYVGAVQEPKPAKNELKPGTKLRSSSGREYLIVGQWSSTATHWLYPPDGRLFELNDATAAEFADPDLYEVVE